MSVSRFLHVKLDVADLDRSLRFYCGGLGLDELVHYRRTDGVTIVQVGPVGQNAGIELWREGEHKGFGNDRLHVAFEVAELDKTLLRLAQEGGTIDRAPFRIGHERIAFVRDPDGYLVELNEINPA